MAVEPDSSAERKKLAEVLERLGRQDPTFNASVSEETGQTIVSGMGELHLEVIRERLQREFGLKVRVDKPRVSDRETIKKAHDAEAEFSRTSGGEAQFAAVKVRIEPFEGEEAVTLENQLKPGVLPDDLVNLLEQTVLDEARSGGVVGYPLMNVKLTILDVKTRVGETTELALTAAATEAVRDALDAAGIVLLEPVMSLEVIVPEEFLGNIQSDLQARRALIVNSERRGNLYSLQAEVPLAEMFGYSTQVRSLSQGRASYSMEPLKYAPAPAAVLQEMMG